MMKTGRKIPRFKRRIFTRTPRKYRIRRVLGIETRNGWIALLIITGFLVLIGRILRAI